MKRHFAIIIFSFCLLGCNQRANYSDILTHLQKTPEDFNTVVVKTFSDPKLLNNLNRIVKFSELLPETRAAIQQIDFGTIYYVILTKENCSSETSMKLEISNTQNEHIEFSQCRDTIHEPGQREKVSDGFIEVFYLNDHWTIWTDFDPL